MLVATPAFVLLGAISISSLMGHYVEAATEQPEAPAEVPKEEAKVSAHGEVMEHKASVSGA